MRTYFLHRIARLPNAWLLLSLVALVVLYPMIEPNQAGRAASAAFDLLILALALRAARVSVPEARLGYVLVVPAVVLHVVAAFTPGLGWQVANLATQALFHAFVVVCLLRYMLRDEVMTLDELFAAAGLYVLMAFVFAYLYAMVELLSPGAFFINPVNNPGGVTRWWDLLYFSFTCLTSVGFGEITPVSDHARSLVMIQQMVGVLYLALVISRLVAMQAGRRRD
ncbi:MAG: two pore domain potassium channel family protein [Arenimonas sp.]|nr:two pore domain potassium channel family protein [Arenimonas sp.]MBP6626380.1 two pore domain potassium channel family protein [Arenimonas sp.]